MKSPRIGDSLWPKTVRQARRILFFVAGTTLLVFGIVMLVTPGPGWLLILAGLSVLAVEFAWARRLLKRIKATGGKLLRTSNSNKT